MGVEVLKRNFFGVQMENGKKSDNYIGSTCFLLLSSNVLCKKKGRLKYSGPESGSTHPIDLETTEPQSRFLSSPVNPEEELDPDPSVRKGNLRHSPIQIKYGYGQ